jgi:hypothetical protein
MVRLADTIGETASASRHVIDTSRNALLLFCGDPDANNIHGGASCERSTISPRAVAAGLQRLKAASSPRSCRKTHQRPLIASC